MKRVMIAAVMIGSLGALIQAHEVKKERVFVTKTAKEIRKVVQLHYEGITRGDRAKLEQSWALNQSYVNFMDKDANGVDQVYIVDTKFAFNGWTRESAVTSMGQVLSLDIADDKMAFVKFDLHYNTQRYIDYLTLYKINGDWKLVHRSFIERPKGTP